MNNLFLALIAFISTILPEYIFSYVKELDPLIPLKNYIVLFVVYVIFTFSKHSKLRLFFLTLIPTLGIVQMLHISFYGMPVYPSAIYLFFTETGEVFSTLKEEISLFFLPLLITVPFLFLTYIANKKVKLKKSVPFLPLLIFIYLAYNPLRTYFTSNSWGRQPSTQEFMGMNIYLSSSYFLGKILPYKIFKQEGGGEASQSVRFKEIPKFAGNIIFVIGESLSANHLSLLGYHRKTTPRLDKMFQDPNFIYSTGVSSGVSTDISLAFLINNTYGLRGQRTVIRGQQCLFKLAKKNGFKTSFYSAQSQQQLRYITNSICLGEVDTYKNLEEIQPNIHDSNAANDLELLKSINQDLYLDKSKNHLYVLHQRGSHGPYNLRYPQNDPTFKLIGNYQKDRINHYDNSVIEFDKFMNKLINIVKENDKPTVIIYVSDHGEGLGEEGVWGHAALKRPSFLIPVLLYFHKTEVKKDLSINPTHLEVSLFISELLGFDANIKFPLKKYSILGNDMDGFAGYLDLDFENGKLKSFVRKDLD